MISILSGDVLDARIDSLIINVGGVGLHVICSPDTIAAAKVGQRITIHTSLIVREESLTLFGFLSQDNRELFDIIQGVSGFGPKLAFTVLATLPGDELRRAIQDEDVARLTKTPGVGAKGAARLILELKDRIGRVSNETKNVTVPRILDEVEQAVIGLGWSARDASRVVAMLAQDPETSTDDRSALLRKALVILGQS